MIKFKEKSGSRRSRKFVSVSDVFVDGVEFRLPYLSKQKRENTMKNHVVSVDTVIKSAVKHV